MTPTAFGPDWWIPPRKGGGLRLGLGLLAATLILAALGGVLGFLVGGSNLTEADQVQAVATTLGVVALAAFAALSVSTGLAAALLLWATRRRSVLAFAAAGAAAGAVFGAIAPVLTGEDVTLGAVGFMAVGGAMHLLIVRWVAGVRNGPGDDAEAAAPQDAPQDAPEDPPQ
ncbi:MAG: hypothetical protein AAF192_19795, partial [Pseudomonadota bacterium]